MIAFDLDDFELAPTAPGLRVSFPVHSAAGAASTAAVLFELDPGAELGVHTDSAEELLIIVQGTAEARVGDEVGRLETHQVGLVPPMAPHGATFEDGYRASEVCDAILRSAETGRHQTVEYRSLGNR